MVPRFFPRVEAKRLVDAVAVVAKKDSRLVWLRHTSAFDWYVNIGDQKQPHGVISIDRTELPFWQRRRLLRIARAATLKTKTGLIQ